MNIRVSLLSVVLSGTAFNVSSAEDYQAYIVNGSDANITTFSSYAALFLDLIDYNNTYYAGNFCGATILDSQHILTAAHCFYTTDPNNSLYSLFTTVVPLLQNESDFPYSVVEKQRVSEIYYPDTYQNSTLYDDIAILKLESPLTKVGLNDYANRPDTGSTYRNTSMTFYAVGHGNTSSSVDNEDSLQMASLSYVDNSSCNYSNINDNKLCMEGAVNSSNGLEASTCQGDSGGPLYWYYGSQYYQVGLTSYGPATFCGDASYSATSVFTEIYDYKDWINSVLAGTETPKFVATDAKRQAYVDAIGTESSSSSSDSGGGTMGSVALFLLGIFAIMRRRLTTN